VSPAFRAAAVVAMDRALLGDRRRCRGHNAAVQAGRWWASVIQAARMFGGAP
jgi:hypothetical protein